MNKQEAIKILKEFHDTSAVFSVRTALETVFPELKEDEDEKIRKLLICGMNALKEQKTETFATIPIDDAIAWLEKQKSVGEIVERCKKSWYNEGKIQGQIEGLTDDEKYQQGWHDALEKQGDKDKLIQELGEYKVKYTQEVLEKHVNNMSNKDDERLRKTTISFLKDFAKQGYENAVECIDWLEKQGESIKIKKGKNYLCTKTHKYAGVEWIEGVKYYSPEDYSLINQGCTCYCPKYSKEEHNNFFKEVEYNGCLEKQGEQKSILNVPPREVILSIWDLGNEWKELTNGSISTEYGTQLDYIQKHWTESEYYLREKQDEQKTSVIDFKAKDWYVSKVDGKIHNIYNSVDKIEPKFHEGDWVVQEDIGVYKVIEVCESWYEVVDNEDKHYSIGFDKEYMCHIWTIQDAKDGDVLISKDKEDILIYKSYSVIDLLLTSYISFSKKEGFCPRQYSAWDSNEFIPATKEQRDFLFSKMHEAGYEWDAYKKELKKIRKPLYEAGNIIGYKSHYYYIKKVVKNEEKGFHYNLIAIDGGEVISIGPAGEKDIILISNNRFDYENANIQQKDFAPKASTANRQLYNRAILKLLSDYVEKYPDIRFGQMLCNLDIKPHFDEESRETYWNLCKTINKQNHE